MAERRFAFLFPGQGSQYPGMGQQLAEAEVPARAVFDAADRTLDGQVSRLCFDGPASELTLTENTQPCVLTVSIAADRALRARGIAPAAVAGHSLGEYTALVSAGALGFEEAVELVRRRGRYMQDAVPIGEGAMAAIMGLEAKQVQEICDEAAGDEIVTPANYNTAVQTVVAGHAGAVQRAVALAEARGAKRAVMLAVSAPFHSPLMEPAGRRLAADLDATTFNAAAVPVVTNVNAEFERDGGALREGLKRQMTAPVLWAQTIQRLVDDGIRTFVEVGPGKVLTGLSRRIDRELELVRVEDPTTLEQAVARLGGTP